MNVPNEPATPHTLETERRRVLEQVETDFALGRFLETVIEVATAAAPAGFDGLRENDGEQRVWQLILSWAVSFEQKFIAHDWNAYSPDRDWLCYVEEVDRHTRESVRAYYGDDVEPAAAASEAAATPPKWVPLPAGVEEALGAVEAYLTGSEKADYRNATPEEQQNHIYRHVLALRYWHRYVRWLTSGATRAGRDAR